MKIMNTPCELGLLRRTRSIEFAIIAKYPRYAATYPNTKGHTTWPKLIKNEFPSGMSEAAIIEAIASEIEALYY